MKKLFVVDYMAMAFRNFHAFGYNPLKTSEGLPTSAVFGSANFLIKLIREENPDYLVVATDSKEKTFRHDMYPDYKANRTEMPEDLAIQLPYLDKLINTLNIPILKQSGVEADDLIGSLAKHFQNEELEIYIVSGDKDFMQLINDKTFLYAPKKNAPAQILDKNAVKEKFGCTPPQVIDILGLMGDSADNVPGVKGIGEKGAIKLIEEFSSIESIYDNIEKINNKRQKTGLEANKDMALLSKQLVTIKTDIPIKVKLDEMKWEPADLSKNKDLIQLFEDLEFKNLIRSVENMSENSSADSTEHNKEKPRKQPTAKNDNYIIIDSNKTLNQLINELRKSDTFSFDTETTGLHCAEDTPIGISFGFASSAYYLPITEKALTGLDLSLGDIRSMLKPALESESKTKIAHNAKFDIQMLGNVDIQVSLPIMDTMLISYLIDPIAKSHSLDECCLRYLNYKKIATSTFKNKDGVIDMTAAPLDELGHYACEDADYTYRLYQDLLPKLKEMELYELAKTVEMPLIPILAEMEKTGVFIDSETLAEISEHLMGKITGLENQIYEIADEKFNINSTKQLRHIMYDKLNIPEQLNIKKIKKTKSGLSTDVSVLEKLSAHPLPKAILEYRQYAKLKNTYVDTLPQLISPKTGRVHTSFHQTGTSTGRLSSSDPNLQNIPIRSAEGKKIRLAFRPQEKTWKMISADYSQVELRILAHIADERSLIEAFKANKDIHSDTAIKIFGEQAKGSADFRAKAKSINFGIIYGMGPQRLSRETGVTLAEAKEFIEKYFQSYPAIKDYINTAKQNALDLGYSKTILGRKRPIPEIKSNNPMMRVNGENIAINSPIQGSAADLIKLAMIDINREFKQRGLSAKMIMQVHDELVFCCPEKESEDVKNIVKSCMENAYPLKVPILVEIGEGNNWLEAH